MPRPKRTKITATRTPALTKDSLAQDTVSAATAPNRQDAPNPPGAEKDLVHHKIASDGNILALDLENHSLQNAQRRKRVERERQKTDLEDDEGQDLRRTYQKITRGVEQEIFEVARQRTVLDYDEDLDEVATGNITSGVGPERTAESRTPRGSHDTAKALESIHALDPSASGIDRPAEAQPGSALKPQATPSSLSLANFKRRPRQPSILRMVQQSLANEDTIIANDARPELEDDSILAALQQPSPTREQGGGSEPSLTPIPSSSASRKRKASALDDLRVPAASQSPSESQRLPSDPAELVRDTAPSSPSIRGRNSRSRSAVVESPARATPRSTRSYSQKKQASPQNHFSSSIPTATSPLSSLSSSPPHPAPSRRTATGTPKKSKPLPIKTAAMKAVLPPRRQPPPNKLRGAFDIPSDDTVMTADDVVEEEEDDDIDELQRPVRRRVKAKSKKNAALQNTKTANGKARKTLGKSLKTSNAKRKTMATAKSTATRTYGKENAAEDVEDSGVESIDDDNNVQDVTSGPVRKAATSKELDEAKEKFKAVDEWDLEFESNDLAGGSSSPWR